MELNLPKLIGHRGVKDLAPENTIESINKAIDFNLAWVEIDVKISKDRIPFLLHDDKLDRTTSGKGKPFNLKYENIKKLDAGQWFNKRYKNSYPPTLHEVLKLCFKKKIGINIELKPNQRFKRENVLAIVKLIKKFKYKYYFSSFDWFSCVLIKKFLPSANVGILINSFQEKDEIIKILKKCKKNKFFSCGFNIKIISNKIIKLCKSSNMKITVYSSQNIEKKQANKLWHLGVNSIFIDNPKSYKNILK